MTYIHIYIYIHKVTHMLNKFQSKSSLTFTAMLIAGLTLAGMAVITLIKFIQMEH